MQTFKNNKENLWPSFPTCELWTTSGRENSLLSQLHQQSTKRHTLLSSIGCGVTPALSAHSLNIVMLCGGRLADAIITQLCNGSFQVSQLSFQEYLQSFYRHNDQGGFSNLQHIKKTCNLLPVACLILTSLQPLLHGPCSPVRRWTAAAAGSTVLQ